VVDGDIEIGVVVEEPIDNVRRLAGGCHRGRADREPRCQKWRGGGRDAAWPSARNGRDAARSDTIRN
jgi:hypothetical protein